MKLSKSAATIVAAIMATGCSLEVNRIETPDTISRAAAALALDVISNLPDATCKEIRDLVKDQFPLVIDLDTLTLSPLGADLIDGYSHVEAGESDLGDGTKRLKLKFTGPTPTPHGDFRGEISTICKK